MTGKEAAIEIQTKFAFYMVALVFTILALAVETAEFGVAPFPDAFELLSWVLLLGSGLCGLKRLEIVPRVHSIGDLEPSTSEGQNLKDKTIDKKQKSAMRIYRAHMWLFVIGIVSLLISRAYPGLSALYFGQSILVG